MRWKKDGSIIREREMRGGGGEEDEMKGVEVRRILEGGEEREKGREGEGKGKGRGGSGRGRRVGGLGAWEPESEGGPRKD